MADAAACSVLPQADHMVAFPIDSPSSLPEMQTFPTSLEKALLKQNLTLTVKAFGMDQMTNPVFFPHYTKLTHGKDHVSKGRWVLSMMTQHWFTKGFSTYADKHCHSCMICATNNPGRTPIQPPANPLTMS